MVNKRFFILSLMLLALLASYLPSTQAATSVGIKVTGSGDVGTCVGSSILGEWVVTGTTDDGGGLDRVGWRAFDGAGKIIYSFSTTVPAAGNTTLKDPFIVVSGHNGQFNIPIAQPFTIEFYDLNAAGAFVTKLASTQVDAGTYIASCANLPYGPPLDPDGDADNDGVLNKSDNCPFVANADQLDGFGGPEGDVCDNSIYDNGAGVKAFQQKNSELNVHGACFVRGSKVECPLIARIQFRRLNPANSPQRFTTNAVPDWYVDVFYLGASGTQQVYQVNTYGGGGLQDDRLELVINPDNTGFWRRR